jgi:voltage-gated potassium channel
MYTKIKEAIYDTLVNEKSRTLASRIFNIFIIILIICYIIIFAISTIGDILTKNYKFFIIFEALIIIIFTVEYILRIWSCNIDKRFSGIIKGRLKYMVTPLMLIDLMAIAPFYLVLFTQIDLKYLALGRLFRLLRIFHFSFFNRAFNVLTRAIRKKSRELVITLLTVLVLIFFCAVIIYAAEHRAQPDVYKSIPDSIYWAFVTFSTVGYGDMTPVTPFGRFFTAIASFLGVGLIAIPAGIISSGMTEVVREMQSKQKKNKCPNCGTQVDSE